jgi:hypothetical protein
LPSLRFKYPNSTPTASPHTDPMPPTSRQMALRIAESRYPKSLARHPNQPPRKGRPRSTPKAAKPLTVTHLARCQNRRRRVQPARPVLHVQGDHPGLKAAQNGHDHLGVDMAHMADPEDAVFLFLGCPQ